MDAKDKKKKYGVTMAPIPCTEAWRRDMPFDHKSKGIETWSYILIDRYRGTRVHVNTYNGATGPGHNTDRCTFLIKKFGTPEGEKELLKSLRTGKPEAYSRCRIGECAVASLAAPPEGWTGPILIDIRYEIGPQDLTEVDPEEAKKLLV